MADFTVNVANISKVEFKTTAANLAIKDLPEVGQSLLLTNVPWMMAAAVNDAKLSTQGQGVLVEMFFNTVDKPVKAAADDFYTAQYYNRLEIRS